MSTIDLKERLIEKIQEINDDGILAEAYRLLGLEFEGDEPFKLSVDQKKAVIEARTQIRKGAYLTDLEADKEIDEWLKE